MIPLIVLVVGAVLLAGAVGVMFWCGAHPEFGKPDHLGQPHYTMQLSEWMWAPCFLGLALILAAFGGLAMGVA